MDSKHFIIIVLILMVKGTGFSQWIQTDGPYEQSKLTAILKTDSNIFASSPCGLHIADNVNSRWKYYADISIDVFDQKGDSVFFHGTGYYPGVNLVVLSGQQPEVEKLNGWISPETIKSSDTCLYVGSGYAGFYKSLGFSNSWIKYNEGLPTDTVYYGGGAEPPSTNYYTYVYSIGIIGTEILCGTNKGVYKSDIQNIIWTESNMGMPNETISILEVYNDTVFACHENTLYYSSDRGDSWSQLYTSPSKINSFTKINDIYYISTSNDGIYKSSNNLQIWYSFNDGLTDLNIVSVDIIDTALVCAAADGFYYSSNSNWINNTGGIIYSQIIGLESTNDSLVSHSLRKAYRYSGLQSWESLNIPEIVETPGLNAGGIGSIEARYDTLFISYQYPTTNNPYRKNFIQYSSNFGQTWKEVFNKASHEPKEQYFLHIHGNRIYRYRDKQMFYTDDLGSNWVDLSLPPEFCSSFRGFTVFNNIPFASTCGGGELLKLNPENDWILTNNGLPVDQRIYDLAITTDAIYAFVATQGMYISQDMGQSWTKANNGLDVAYTRSSTFKDKNLFITSDKGVYYTDNHGQNWHALNDGLIDLKVVPIEILNDTLYVGTPRHGVWKYDISSIPLSINEYPGSNKLLNVYPNPASDVLNIYLPDHAKGELQLIDIMGKTIKSTLMDSSEKIDISDVPSGIYMILFNTGNSIYSNKIILL